MDSRQALMLLVVTAGAFIVPIISERIGWFTAPCEMIYGILAANLLPWAHDPGAFITTLAQFGFLLLLFLAGLEIDFTLLRRRGPGMLLRAGLAALGLQLFVLAVGAWLHLAPIYILLLGAVSISLLLVVLKELQLAQSNFGQTILIVGALGEFLTILEVTAYDLVSRFGVGWPLALAVLKLAALLFVGYLALRLLNNTVTRAPERFGRFFHTRDTAELGVRAALAFMLAFAAIAVLLQVEQTLATFIAGAVCSFAFRGHNTVGRKLSTMGQGFFIPLFFISVGMSLRLSDLLHGETLLLIGGGACALGYRRRAAPERAADADRGDCPGRHQSETTRPGHLWRGAGGRHPQLGALPAAGAPTATPRAESGPARAHPPGNPHGALAHQPGSELTRRSTAGCQSRALGIEDVARTLVNRTSVCYTFPAPLRAQRII